MKAILGFIFYFLWNINITEVIFSDTLHLFWPRHQYSVLEEMIYYWSGLCLMADIWKQVLASKQTKPFIILF